MASSKRELIGLTGQALSPNARLPPAIRFSTISPCPTRQEHFGTIHTWGCNTVTVFEDLWSSMILQIPTGQSMMWMMVRGSIFHSKTETYLFAIESTVITVGDWYVLNYSILRFLIRWWLQVSPSRGSTPSTTKNRRNIDQRERTLCWRPIFSLDSSKSETRKKISV